ncbi:MAG: hypothetical protein IJC16_00105 [Rikenellaceae bacterium]|nr:hypothetical protein [Rikenellaceae bacterium]
MKKELNKKAKEVNVTTKRGLDVVNPHELTLFGKSMNTLAPMLVVTFKGKYS